MHTKKLHKTIKTAIARNHEATKANNRQTINAIATMALCLLVFSPEIALAEPWDSIAQKVLDIFTNGLTRTIAIITVIACGLAALAGKLSYDWAVKIVIGITLIFGSAAIVDFFISAAA